MTTPYLTGTFYLNIKELGLSSHARWCPEMGGATCGTGSGQGYKGMDCTVRPVPPDNMVLDPAEGLLFTLLISCALKMAME